MVLDRIAGCEYGVGAGKKRLCGVRRAASVSNGQRRGNISPIIFRNLVEARGGLSGFAVGESGELDWGHILWSWAWNAAGATGEFAVEDSGIRLLRLNGPAPAHSVAAAPSVVHTLGARART